MTDKRDATRKLLPANDRLNGIGHFIRSTSMDELPSLINLPGVINFEGGKMCS